MDKANWEALMLDLLLQWQGLSDLMDGTPRKIRRSLRCERPFKAIYYTVMSYDRFMKRQTVELQAN